jgi:probable phosphoglycerate mutase
MPRADRTTGTRPDRKAPSRRRPTPATVVLLVRHGTTATTGTKLPGRAPGLHLAEAGVRQAEDVAARIVRVTTPPPADGEPAADAAATPAATPTTPTAAVKPGPTTGASANGDGSKPAPKPRRRRPKAPPGPAVAAVYSSPLERTRETAEAIATAVGREVQFDDGLLELDIGDWTGLDLKDARKRPEWATIQGYPSGFTFPGGESFTAMQSRMVDTLARLRARHPGETVVAVSHADPIRAVVAHAMGTHLDLFQRIVVSPCSLTALVLSDGGPTVLTVNATGDHAALAPS